MASAPRRRLLSALLSAVGAAILTPLVVFVGMMSFIIFVWSTKLALSIPGIFETTYEAGTGHSVEVQGGPGFAAVMALLGVGIAVILYIVDRRSERAHSARHARRTHHHS